MIRIAESKTYYINERALSFVENDKGNPNRVSVALSSGAAILVYAPAEGIDFGVDGSYQKWKLEGYDTLLVANNHKYIYARLSRSESTALIVFDEKLRSVQGGELTIKEDESGNTVTVEGPANEDYYFVKIGELTATDGTSERVLTYDSGLLSTPQRMMEAENKLDEMFELDKQMDPYLIMAKYGFKKTSFQQIVIGEALLEYDEVNKAVRVRQRDAEEGEKELAPIQVGFYAEGFVSAKGASSGGQGGGGGASALYQLNDVLKNEAGDGVLGAAKDKVLMFNGTHWYAGDAKGKVVALKVGQEEYKPSEEGIVTLPEFAKVVDKTLMVDKFIGDLQGNADTATKLKNALTIQKNKTEVGVFDGSEAKTVNIEVPTKVSELENDSKFLTDHQKLYALTIQGNGALLGTYTPNSEAKTINLTAANIGAAAASHTHNYLPLSGGTLGSSSASNTAVYWASRGGKLCIVSDGDAGNFIESGNADFSGNATLSITGYYGTVGSNLYLKFANIYCRENGYVNLDSGNYNTYAAAKEHTHTIAQVTGLQSSLDSKLNASVFNDLFEKVLLSDGVTYAIRAKYGFYSDSFVSAKGANSSIGGSTGGAASIKIGSDLYTPDGEGIIHLPAYPTVPTSLKNPYALTIQKNGITQGVYDGSSAKTVNITVPTKVSELTNDSNYLTAHQTLYALTIQGNGTSLGVYTPNSEAKTINITAAGIGAAAATHKQAYTADECTTYATDDNTMGVTPAAVKKAIGLFEPKAHTHNVLGTVTAGSSSNPVYFNAGVPTAVDKTATFNALVNSIAVGFDAPTDADYYISQYVGGGTENTTYRRRSHSTLYAYIKGKAEGTWGINITGNASSATKLQTARKIWGQSFDGSADVSGAMTGVTSITIGDCVITYDSANKGLKFSTGIYSEQYVSAKGANSSTGGSTGGAASIYLGSDLYTPDGEGIIHLPAYPTVPTSLKNPYALTIQKNGVTQGVYDGSVAKEINLSVPTKVSELTNDSNYLTAHQTLYSLTIQGNGTTIGTYTPNSEAKSINITAAGIGAAEKNHAHAISQITDLQTKLDDKYSSSASRMANTILAAPNGSAGSATFRKLVASDLPEEVNLYTELGVTYSDYAWFVIGLFSIGNTYMGGTGTSQGSIYINRNAGSHWSVNVEYTISNSYSSSSLSQSNQKVKMVVRQLSIESSMTPCTFVYNGVKYAGLVWRSQPSPNKAKVMASYAQCTPFFVRYYNSDSKSVLNSEIYNSIRVNDADIEYQEEHLYGDLKLFRGCVTADAFTGKLNGNADTATKLQTSRLIWGQTFDGSADVSGALTGVTSITIGDCVITYDSTNKGLKFSTGIYSEQYVSAKGANSSTGGSTGGAASIYVGSTLYTPDEEGIIHLPAYPTVPDSLKNPYALTIQANGTSLGTYDGSAAKIFNLTYANVGAAAASHKQAYTSDECTTYATDDNTMGVTPAAVKKAIGLFEPKAHTHNVLGTVTAGSSSNPVYFNAGVPTACDKTATFNALVNSATIGYSTPEDADYYISQSVGGGTSVTTYHRRSHSALYTYLKGKAEGTWGISISGNAASATQLATARTLWGQSFDGTANVSGALSGVDTITANSNFYLYPVPSDKTNYYLSWGGTDAPFTLNTVGAVTFGSSSGYAFKNSVGININGNGITGSYVKLNNTSGNPYLQLVSGGTWYIQAYVGYLFLGSTSAKALRISSDGETYSPSNIYAAGAITAKSSSSDIRLKRDLTEYDALSIVRGQRSVMYHWNETAKRNSAIFDDDDWHYGLIAQELQREHPQLVKDVFGDYLTIDYERLIPILWRAVQQLAKRNEELEVKLNEERRA